VNELYRMNKDEAEARLNHLFEQLGQYPMCQAISDEIDRTMEYLNELED
jgi:hypothetical protein